MLLPLKKAIEEENQQAACYCYLKEQLLLKGANEIGSILLFR